MRKLGYLIKTNIKRFLKRYILILFVLAFSSATIIVSFDFKNVSKEAVYSMLDEQTLGIHLSVRNKDRTKGSFYYQDAVEAINNRDDIAYNVKVYSANVLYSSKNLSLVGISKKDYSSMRIKVIDELSDNYSNGIFISNTTSSLYALSLGDEVNLTINGEDTKVIVNGIVENTAFMIQNSNSFLCDFDFLTEKFGEPGKATALFVSVKDINQIDKVYNEILNKFEGNTITITKNFNLDSYTFYLEPISIGITIFSIFAIFITSFLCYFVFKNLILSRQKRIATQKSLGVTKKDLYIASIVETLCLTLLASLVGVLLACYFNNILSILFTGVGALKFRFTSYLIALGIVLTISLFSLILSHYSTFKKSVISLLKGSSSDNNIQSIKKRRIRIISSLGFVLLSSILIIFLFNNSTLPARVISIASSIILIIVIAYYAILALLHLLNKIHFKKSIFYIENKRSLSKKSNIITLTIFVILLVSTATTVSEILTKTLSTYYTNIDALIQTSDEASMKKILDEEKDKYFIETYYECYNVNLSYEEDTLYFYGVNTQDYLNYSQDGFVSESPETMLDKLNKIDKSIIISTTLANKHGLKVEDKISFLTKNGAQDFVIIGFVNSFENGGKNVIVSDHTFIDNFYYQLTSFYITQSQKGTINDLIQLYNDCKNKFFISIYDVHVAVEQNNSSIKQIMNMIYCLIVFISALAMINIIVSMVLNIKEKSKTIAIEESLGKSKHTIFLETAYGEVFDIIIPSLIAVLFSGIINYFVFEIINSTIGYFTYSYSISIYACITSLIIYGLGILFSYKNIKKVNIIEGIKGGSLE